MKDAAKSGRLRPEADVSFHMAISYATKNLLYRPDCHKIEQSGVLIYHFLGVVGEKLFDNPYALLRNILKQSHIRSDLRQLLKELKLYRGKNPKKGRFGPGRVREDLLALVYWIIQGEGKRTQCIHSVCRTSISSSDVEMPCSAPILGCAHTSKSGRALSR